jgi:D-beta-D-heptose 7-phosphate kinase / D-beta-D-heptose 1-phosphate adenosyltransferase
MTVTRPKILVVGDVILDRYVNGRVKKFSPEDPTCLILNQTDPIELRPGGAANVAVNAAALGADVIMVGVVGDKSYLEQLSGAIQIAGRSDSGNFGSVTIAAHESIQRLTTVKTRYCAAGRQLLRVDSEESGPLLSEDNQALDLLVADAIDQQLDMVVLSDYAKGVITDNCGASEFRSMLVDRLAISGVPYVVDPKGSDCQYGMSTGTSDVSNLFPLAICPNQQEFSAEMIERAKHVVMTCASAGCVIYGSAGYRNAIPVPEQIEIHDPTGAGDVFIAALAVMLCAGQSIRQACWMANVAAMQSVKHYGTRVISAEQFYKDCKEFEDAYKDYAAE